MFFANGAEDKIGVCSGAKSNLVCVPFKNLSEKATAAYGNFGLRNVPTKATRIGIGIYQSFQTVLVMGPDALPRNPHFQWCPW